MQSYWACKRPTFWHNKSMAVSFLHVKIFCYSLKHYQLIKNGPFTFFSTLLLQYCCTKCYYSMASYTDMYIITGYFRNVIRPHYDTFLRFCVLTTLTLSLVHNTSLGSCHLHTTVLPAKIGAFHAMCKFCFYRLLNDNKFPQC